MARPRVQRAACSDCYSRHRPQRGAKARADVCEESRPRQEEGGVKTASRRTPMAKVFDIGDHVRWNSEAGRVSGVIIKKITSDTRIKGYVRHASKESPQYAIKSDKTDHVAIHKG